MRPQSRLRNKKGVPTVFQPWRWLAVVSFFAGLTALVITLWPRESSVFIDRTRADAKESDRLLGQLRKATEDWSAVPHRLDVLESGDFTPIDGQHFKLSLGTAERVANGPLNDLPKNARQLLLRFWIYTAGVNPGVPRQLTLSIKGPSGSDLKFPFYFHTYPQQALSYYSQFLWIPVPKDGNIYTQPDKTFNEYQHCGGNIDIIGWR